MEGPSVAKPRADKSEVIREAIAANPRTGNDALAELLNDSTDRLDDRLVFTAADVAAARKAGKKRTPAAAAPAGTAPAPAPEPADDPPAPPRDAPPKQNRPRQPPPVTPPAARPDPVDLIDRVFELAKECGGFEQLKRLVDRIAEIRRR
jgi:hypothetical protein